MRASDFEQRPAAQPIEAPLPITASLPAEAPPPIEAPLPARPVARRPSPAAELTRQLWDALRDAAHTVSGATRRRRPPPQV